MGPLHFKVDMEAFHSTSIVFVNVMRLTFKNVYLFLRIFKAGAVTHTHTHAHTQITQRDTEDVSPVNVL